jgi:hypothetical protein
MPLGAPRQRPGDQLGDSLVEIGSGTDVHAEDAPMVAECTNEAGVGPS